MWAPCSWATGLHTRSFDHSSDLDSSDNPLRNAGLPRSFMLHLPVGTHLFRESQAGGYRGVVRDAS